MKNAMTIREAVTETDIAVFWTQLRLYFERDIFPEIPDRETGTERTFWERNTG